MVRPTLSLDAADAAQLLNTGLIGVNMRQMRLLGPTRPRIHELIKGGLLKYSPYDPDEEWQDYKTILRKLKENGEVAADCEDLASAAAAEMQVDTFAWYHDPLARPVVYKSGPRLAHVVVYSPKYGKLLDPSVAAGMGRRGHDY